MKKYSRNYKIPRDHIFFTKEMGATEKSAIIYTEDFTKSFLISKFNILDNDKSKDYVLVSCSKWIESFRVPLYNKDFVFEEWIYKNEFMSLLYKLESLFIALKRKIRTAFLSKQVLIKKQKETVVNNKILSDFLSLKNNSAIGTNSTKYDSKNIEFPPSEPIPPAHFTDEQFEEIERIFNTLSF